MATPRYTVRDTIQRCNGKPLKVYEVYDNVIRDWVAQYTYRPAAKGEANRRNEEQKAIDEANSRTEASA